tara:strand:+ start:4359 stop:5192 length:834 start_codon:yes stop_codon:yes gene_type:complete
MATKKTTEVATVTPGAVALPFDYGDDAGQGMEITMDDLKIPFIALVQNDSKVLDADEPNYVPGGSAGMLFNGATRQFSDDLILVPALRQTTYVEWLPDRGGFADEHAATSPIVAEAKRNAAKKYELRTEGGNDLEETRSIYAIVLDSELNPVGYCVVPFTGSKMGPWRDFWTKIDTARVSKDAPLFSLMIRISSFDDKNKAGKKYKNYLVNPARDAEGNMTSDPLAAAVAGSMLAPTSPQYLAAKQLREAIQSGSATADRETADAGSGSGKTEDTVF